MDHGANVGPHLVDLQMHRDLAGPLQPARYLVALVIDDDQVVHAERALADAGGRGQDALGIQAQADISVVGGYPALLKDQLADLDNVLAVFAFCLYHCGIFDCSKSSGMMRLSRQSNKLVGRTPSSAGDPLVAPGVGMPGPYGCGLPGSFSQRPNHARIAESCAVSPPGSHSGPVASSADSTFRA